MSPKIKYFINPNSTEEDNVEKYSGWRQRVAQIGKKSSKWQRSFFFSHEQFWAQTNNSRRLLFESAILAPQSLGYLGASLTPRVWDIWMLPWPPKFGTFGCFLDPIKDHVVLLSASVTFLCKGQNILNTLNRTIAFPREDRCGKYFVIQLVCELQLSRQYNTPQRYGGLIALSWKIYRFRKVCSVCHYEIVNTVNKRNRARHI